ncbi:MAG: IPT/TIG domain-containing protein [Candidatus Melainabacteria bacterium]|nr:IPT/TIG domain-containing protein [Candidatus Melainabacteria bacterium]
MKSSKLIAIIFSLVITTGIAYAFSNCMQKYASHPRAIPSQKNNCAICHKNANGTGPQNAFGQAFASAGFMITNKLITDFPDLFLPDESNETVETVDEDTSQPPLIKRIKPKKVQVSIQTTIQVKGNNFDEEANILIDESETSTTFQSSMALITDITLEQEGIHKVKVKNSNGQESNEVNLKAKQPKKKK